MPPRTRNRQQLLSLVSISDRNRRKSRAWYATQARFLTAKESQQQHQQTRKTPVLCTMYSGHATSRHYLGPGRLCHCGNPRFS